MERRLQLVPFDARILDPEACLLAPTRTGHGVGVEELKSDVEAAHRDHVVDMAQQFTPQGIWIALWQRMRGARGRQRRALRIARRLRAIVFTILALFSTPNALDSEIAFFVRARF
jgi:hypothetical protein